MSMTTNQAREALIETLQASARRAEREVREAERKALASAEAAELAGFPAKLLADLSRAVVSLRRARVGAGLALRARLEAESLPAPEHGTGTQTTPEGRQSPSASSEGAPVGLPAGAAAPDPLPLLEAVVPTRGGARA